MKKVYALFSYIEGEGVMTFITTFTTPINLDILPKIGDAIFLVGYTNALPEEVIDPADRSWEISEYKITLYCSAWPFFRQKR